MDTVVAARVTEGKPNRPNRVRRLLRL